ncbi:MAG TPA: riboflavin synthase [Candidatus Thioglobus sp.]|jgi:riboflavin synthase|nr:riboflavin synthase [Candidatus Thioglobus sp.]HIL42435.1 riboflavin synthase [Gammaproteobacteria bacterium]
MFTGIIQAIGKIKIKEESVQGAVFKFISVDFDFSDSVVGDSISANGVCLTAIEVGDDYFEADISQETLNCSTFGNIRNYEEVNLEKSLRINQGIDGHMVSGHVDDVAKVVEKIKQGDSIRFKFKVPQNLVKYIARKGSVCINGVSLTVNDIDGDVFDINVVPHTMNVTTLSRLNVSDSVNVEVDIIARHLEQLLSSRDL